MTETVLIIPARYQSTRLPGKPCIEFNGIPMVKRVYDACVSTGLKTLVSSDSHTVLNCIPEEGRWFDAQPYANGTERVAGLAKKVAADNYVNVQGDMIDITPDIIMSVVKAMDKHELVTAYTSMPDEQRDDPSTVKLIKGTTEARWFGRGIAGYGEWHLGIYGYKRNALFSYRHYKPTWEEVVEKLEQVRWLKNGWHMECVRVQYDGIEINTPEDVSEWYDKERVR